MVWYNPLSWFKKSEEIKEIEETIYIPSEKVEVKEVVGKKPLYSKNVEDNKEFVRSMVIKSGRKDSGITPYKPNLSRDYLNNTEKLVKEIKNRIS